MSTTKLTGNWNNKHHRKEFMITIINILKPFETSYTSNNQINAVMDKLVMLCISLDKKLILQHLLVRVLLVHDARGFLYQHIPTIKFTWGFVFLAVISWKVFLLKFVALGT